MMMSMMRCVSEFNKLSFIWSKRVRVNLIAQFADSLVFLANGRFQVVCVRDFRVKCN